MKLHSSVTHKAIIKNFSTLEERLCKVHNNKYEYDKAIFISSKSKITITCPIHGDFEQVVSEHLRGRGCNKCAIKDRNSTSDDFIHKATNIHKGKYDYSKVNYIKSSIKVEIVCTVHGVFKQLPSTHLQGVGCPKCGQLEGYSKLTKSQETFIKEANEIHAGKYSYDKTVYKKRHDKIEIYCNTCKEYFWQEAGSHLNGKGCVKCSYIDRANKCINKELNKYDGLKNYFQNKASKEYLNRFDYSKAIYTGSHVEVLITCKKHNHQFSIAPILHFSSKGNGGCVKCKAEITADLRRYSETEFINRCKEVQPKQLDYSKVEYKGSVEKVTLICKEHGEYRQTAMNTLAGKNGCPKCSGKGYSQDIPGYL